MDRKISLIPFTRSVVSKVVKYDDFSDAEKEVIVKVTNNIDDVILNDEGLPGEVNALAQSLHPEPTWAIGTRALIRPLMTLILTMIFVLLVLGQAGFFDITNGIGADAYKEVFTVFLAIYGPIIGFWFGERNAAKNKPSS